jgi:hypothetical protein
MWLSLPASSIDQLLYGGGLGFEMTHKWIEGTVRRRPAARGIHRWSRWVFGLLCVLARIPASGVPCSLPLFCLLRLASFEGYRHARPQHEHAVHAVGSAKTAGNGPKRASE